jgi:hypothetical protein
MISLFGYALSFHVFILTFFNFIQLIDCIYLQYCLSRSYTIYFLNFLCSFILLILLFMFFAVVVLLLDLFYHFEEFL